MAKSKPKTVIICDQGAFASAEITKLEQAGYLVVMKAPGRQVDVLPPLR